MKKYPDTEPTDRHFLGSVNKSFIGTVMQTRWSTINGNNHFHQFAQIRF